MWIRNCPQCNKEFVYHRKARWLKACKRNLLCKECAAKRTWSRNCPECNKELHYTTKAHCKRLQEKNAKCISCTKKKCTGQKNPFFGKKHSPESRVKIKEGVRRNPAKKSPALRDKLSQMFSGSGNNMFGISLYDLWVEKYGKEEADRKNSRLKETQRLNSTGENNPMFGKPSPQGSGNGWSGWYNGVFFRSLHELSYIVLVLEREGKKWESAESMKIPYQDWDGKSRTYRPDFIVDDTELIEIKPARLHRSLAVQLKCQAAHDYCDSNNLSFSLVTPPMLSKEEISSLHESKKIIFTKRYEKKYADLLQGAQA
jgi:hypothetical protein